MGVEFSTVDGRPVPAVTTAQMREVDRVAVEETGPNLYQMMENAGRNLATLAMEMLSETNDRSPILVLAGTGGNGGGGVCAARHLANRGIPVTLCLADPARLSDVTKWQYRVFSGTPGRVVGAKNIAAEHPELILDALIGYSLTGAPSGVYAELIEWANAADARILSLDVPSGLDSTTGASVGQVAEADVTMTLALPKVGLHPDRTGDLFLADIGIPVETYKRVGIPYAPPFGHQYIVRLHAALSVPR